MSKEFNMFIIYNQKPTLCRTNTNERRERTLWIVTCHGTIANQGAGWLKTDAQRKTGVARVERSSCEILSFESRDCGCWWTESNSLSVISLQSTHYENKTAWIGIISPSVWSLFTIGLRSFSVRTALPAFFKNNEPIFIGPAVCHSVFLPPPEGW